MHSSLIEKALEISEKRRNILSRLREALLAKDQKAVIDLAHKITGLIDDEECNPTNSRLY